MTKEYENKLGSLQGGLSFDNGVVASTYPPPPGYLSWSDYYAAAKGYIEPPAILDDDASLYRKLKTAVWDETIKEVAEPAPMEGKKHDAGKDRYELIPPEALDNLARVLTFGAAKYGDRNWEKGMDWSRLFGATMRHLWSWWRGEKADPETGFSHLWHALACVVFLVTFEERKHGKDDRVQPT